MVKFSHWAQPIYNLRIIYTWPLRLARGQSRFPRSTRGRVRARHGVSPARGRQRAVLGLLHC